MEAKEETMILKQIAKIWGKRQASALSPFKAKTWFNRAWRKHCCIWLRTLRKARRGIVTRQEFINRLSRSLKQTSEVIFDSSMKWKYTWTISRPKLRSSRKTRKTWKMKQLDFQDRLNPCRISLHFCVEIGMTKTNNWRSWRWITMNWGRNWRV